MALKAPTLANRFEGRLFSEEGRLYFVIDVNTESGFASVSCRADGRQQVIQMPIAEVGMRLSCASDLQLDGLSSASTNRVIQQSDGWFFATRDGKKGPFRSNEEASAALSSYIIAAQGPAAACAEHELRAVNG